MVSFDKDSQSSKAVLPYLVIEFLENDIMRFEFTKNVFVTMDMALEMTEVCKKLSQGKVYLSLKIIAYQLKIQDAVADYLASDARIKMLRAEAIVLNASTLKIFYNFYLRIKKPVITMKAFNSEDMAVEWLLTQ